MVTKIYQEIVQEEKQAADTGKPSDGKKKGSSFTLQKFYETAVNNEDSKSDKAAGDDDNKSA